MKEQKGKYYCLFIWFRGREGQKSPHETSSHPWAFAQAVSCLETSFLSSSLVHFFPRKPSLSSLISWHPELWLSRAPCTSLLCHLSLLWFCVCLCDYLTNNLVDNQLHDDRSCLFYLFKSKALCLQCVIHCRGLINICWLNEWVNEWVVAEKSCFVLLVFMCAIHMRISVIDHSELHTS